MGKFCLSAVSVWSSRSLIASAVLFLALTGLPAHAASNQATVVLHIQVTVVPTVQAATTRPSAMTTSGAISYSLQPSTGPKMTSQVTVQQFSTAGPVRTGNNGGQSGKGAVLKTTIVVSE